MDKIKILEVVPSLSLSNGVAAYITNYFQNMDLNKFDVTFLIVRERKDKGRYNEVYKNGGKIHELYFEKNIISYSKKVDEYFKNNKYDVVHCNVANVAFVILKYAKKHNVPVRILHSHGTLSSDKFLNRVRNDFLIAIGKKYTNCNFACSKAAGKAMFGKKECYIVNNAINYDKYLFNQHLRDEYRKELNLEDKIIVGTIGRSVPQKNHKFIIKTFREIVNKDSNMHLVIIGGGPLDAKLEKQIVDLKLENNVHLLGNRDDAYKLYNAMDLFVLPSLYEGLPVVGIEAQVNGLRCLFSNTITTEVDISNNCKFIPIKEKNQLEWQTVILNSTNERINNFNKEYDIKYASKEFEKKLIELIESTLK